MTVIFCLKCQKKTQTKNEKKSITSNNKPSLIGNCTICNNKKSMFISAVAPQKKISVAKIERKRSKLKTKK